MLTISTLNYRNWRATAECVRDLADACRGLDYRILIRDNSETPELDELRRDLKNSDATVLYFESSDNPGFGNGHNRNFHAVTHAANDVFLVLNNDVRIMNRETIREMLKVCNANRIVSCVIQDSAGEHVWFAGATLNRLTGDVKINRNPLNGQLRQTDFLSGCCMMIACQTFAALEGFDPRFFMYGEDFDLCLRARSLPAELVVIGFPIVHQIGSGWRGNYSDLFLYQDTKNRAICLLKHRLGAMPISLGYFILKYGVARTLQLAMRSKRPITQIRLAWAGLVEGLSHGV
jgi:GT2 family glycosyltransferase